MRHRRPRPLPTACLSVIGYELRVTMFGFGYDFVLVVFWVLVSISTFGCIFGFGSGSVCCHVACCSRSFMVHCIFLSDTSFALDMWELCCWKGD